MDEMASIDACNDPPEDVNYLLDPIGAQSISSRASQQGVPEADVHQPDIEDEDGEDGDEDVDHLGRHHETYQLSGNRANHEQPVNRVEMAQNTVGGTTLETLVDARARDAEIKDFLDALRHGWHHGIKKLLEQEFQLFDYGKEREAGIKQHTYVILISLDKSIILGLVEGNIDQKYHDDMHTCLQLNQLRDRARETGQPAIYRNALVDAEGLSPTPEQLLEVIDLVERHYLARSYNGVVAAAIDSFRQPASTPKLAISGRRKYLTKDCRTIQNSPLKSRRDRLRRFCKYLRDRIDTMPQSEMQEPLYASLIDIGYSGSVFVRLANDRNHRSSNFIMNVFEAAFSFQFPQHFSIHQHIIYLVTQPMHSSLAEVVLKRLGQGYTCNSGESSVYRARGIYASAKKFSTLDYLEWRQWNCENSPAQLNHQHYKQFLDSRAAAKAHVPTSAKDGGPKFTDRPMQSVEHIQSEDQAHGTRTYDSDVELSEDGEDMERDRKIFEILNPIV